MSSMSRLGDLAPRISLPLIAAPMFQISGPALVIAACNAGVIGAFPTSNCRTLEELDAWLTQMMAMTRAHNTNSAPVCPNLIMRQSRLAEDLALLLKHRVEVVITSVGSPAPVVKPLQEIGCRVFADVATIAHAHKAVAAGVDGLVLLSAGAGGNTGWANPFAFVRGVRQFFDGPIVLAGGITDGPSLLAAQVLGCDLAYMGTRFIATKESLAKAAYKQALIEAELDDIILTKAFTGMQNNMLRGSIVAAGLDPDRLDEAVTAEDTQQVFGAKASAQKPRRWRDIWSAGHSVSGVKDIVPVAELVDRLKTEYLEASAGFSGA